MSPLRQRGHLPGLDYMYKIIRPILFKFFKDPETVHHLALYFLKFLGLPGFSSVAQIFTNINDETLKQKVFGLDFKNPVGLAGGFDKEAYAVKGLEALGFGYLEIGTITRYSQPGNPRPRIFRLAADEALINRMGFNNFGADALAQRLSKLKNLNTPLGISLGKTKITPLEEAAEDYLYSFTKLYDYGDYFAVNISSPNTPGLRDLQDKEHLIEIIQGLANYRAKQTKLKPILVKIAPDLTFEAIDEVLEVCKQLNVDGIIATNTTISREGLSAPAKEIGGLSGMPLKSKSTQIIKHIRRQSPGLPIIGAGGIFTAEDAYEKIRAGASLLQIYTGFIYEGPLVVRATNQGLVKLLKRDGFKNVSEAVGSEN